MRKWSQLDISHKSTKDQQVCKKEKKPWPAIREKQIKTIMRYSYLNQDGFIQKAGEDKEKRSQLYSAGGNVNYYSQ